MIRKSLKITLPLLLIITVLYIFKYDILRASGNFLICEDELRKAEVMFVLSGGAYDRGREAARLFHAGWADKIICTGENKPTDFQAVGLEYYESEITKSQLLREGVPDSLVDLIIKGTSTREEAEIIRDYCRNNNIRNCIIVSSKFHTRRIHSVLKKVFDNQSDINIILRGAPSSLYDENYWWENEYGLIAWNNEYIKLIYYWIKY